MYKYISYWLVRTRYSCRWPSLTPWRRDAAPPTTSWPAAKSKASAGYQHHLKSHAENTKFTGIYSPHIAGIFTYIYIYIFITHIYIWNQLHTHLANMCVYIYILMLCISEFCIAFYIFCIFCNIFMSCCYNLYMFLTILYSVQF